MLDVYNGESDRAAAILAATFLDNTLRELLLSHMIDNPIIKALFEGDRPLASFSARISIAFGLGLLPRNIYADLELVRKIRNHFAHSEVAAIFGVSPVRDWCAELSVVKAGSELAVMDAASDSRFQFLLTIAGTTVYLQHMLNSIRRGPLKRCVLPSPVRFAQHLNELSRSNTK